MFIVGALVVKTRLPLGTSIDLLLVHATVGALVVNTRSPLVGLM
jgi:hypothetical protein